MRFVQFIPGEDSSFLRQNHPNAFLLLSLIAERARRYANLPDGLQVGDAILGDYQAAGLSRQQYRTALDTLVELGYIDIIYNGKTFLKREKSTIKITITGTLVNLKDSRIWDINSEDINQRINQRATNEQPTSNHKQERTIKNKKEEETTTTPLPPKVLKDPDPVVVVLYESLKENKDLTEDEKLIMMQYDEKRVKLALDYAKHVKPSTTLIQMLRWHCKQSNPPTLPQKQKTDQQKIAIEFNAFLLTVGQELMHEQNKTLIFENQIMTPHGSISLHNPISVLRADFEGIKRDYRQRKYG